MMLPILLITTAVMGAQETVKSQDPWQPMRYFVGTWRGRGEGNSGKSSIERKYQFIVQNKYLQETNKATFEAQGGKPAGDPHEDLAIYSYDQTRKMFVLRQFNSEGFVNQYVHEEAGAESRTHVFTTEAIENIPAGWRARTTINILNDDEFEEIFELAKPGKDFEGCQRNHFKRVK